jgi:cytochrome P450
MVEPAPVEYDPFAYETHEDPYPIYQRLRNEAPAYRNERLDFYALSRFADVRAALLDHETYCSGQGFLLEDIDEISLPMVIGMDPPDHTRLRATINRALTPRRVAELEEPIRTLARRLLEHIAAKGEADIIADFAAIVPLHVIAEMLAVPVGDRDELRRLADQMVHRDDRSKGLPPAAVEAATKIGEYFDAMLRERAATPHNDLLSLLLAAEKAGELSREEIIGFCFLLIIAGNETTTKLIGNIVYLLSAHPEERQRLMDDRSLIANAVEETFRYDTSTHMMARTLTRDVTLHGRTLRAGKKVALLLASANRDERHWPEPDRFDIGRDASGHLALGIGIHHCLGAALARMEATVALEEIMARIPDFSVERDGLERVHSGNVRGFAKVPIRFTPT